jgi:hypothetical protein
MILVWLEETEINWFLTKQKVFTLLSYGACMDKRSTLTSCCADEDGFNFPSGKASPHDRGTTSGFADDFFV